MTASKDVKNQHHGASAPGMRTDMIGAIIAAVIFLGALWATLGWPERAAMFPRIIAAAGLFFAVLYLLVLIVKRLRRGSPAPAPDATNDTAHSEATEPVDAPDAADEQMREPEDEAYVFASAGLTKWLAALGWIALFLVLLTLLGLFAASTIFAFGYLRWGARKSWLFSAIYAIVLPVFLILLFRVLLYVPTPLGVLTGF